jgi:hypothetical protein
MNAASCTSCGAGRRHQLVPRRFGRGAPPKAVNALAQFDVSATFRGQSNSFKVYYDDDLGSVTGGALADGILANCDRDFETLSQIFGPVSPPVPMTAIVTPAAGGGAYHYTCIDNVLYVTGNTSSDIALACALVVAEEVEVFCAAQALGWDCGATNGEGLSRVLAEELYPGVLDDFHTADAWLDSTTRPDYLTDNHGTDVDPLSNGCAVLFLYYLRYMLGYDWSTITQTAGATLEETYRRLTGSTGAYSALRTCIDAIFPPGSPSGLIVDNPFPAFDFYSAASAIL